MSQMPYGAISIEDRDQVADDRDEAAWRRDRASAARDAKADERDRRAEGRMQAAMQHATLIRRLLDVAGHQDGQRPGSDQHFVLVWGMLRQLDRALQDAGEDRRAASRDRRAAAADRHQAAEDRLIQAGHREQAAVERAGHAAEQADAGTGRGSGLIESARAACANAEAVCQYARDLGFAAPRPNDMLRYSEFARLRAQLVTMPVIEQAKGIIMTESGCGESEAFDALRQASQRMNEPVRDLAAQIVTRATGTAHRAGEHPEAPAPSRPPGQTPAPPGAAAGCGDGGAGRSR